MALSSTNATEMGQNAPVTRKLNASTKIVATVQPARSMQADHAGSKFFFAIRIFLHFKGPE